MKKSWLVLVSLLTVASILAASCSIDDFELIKRRDDLDRNRELWLSQKPADYRYRLQVSCFCPPNMTQPVIVEVRSGKTVSIVNAQSGTPVQNDFFNNLNTVDKLFDIIQGAITKKAAELTVTYDAQSGYPSHIYIDSIKQAIDDEITYDLTEFTPLK